MCCFLLLPSVLSLWLWPISDCNLIVFAFGLIIWNRTLINKQINVSVENAVRCVCLQHFSFENFLASRNFMRAT